MKTSTLLLALLFAAAPAAGAAQAIPVTVQGVPQLAPDRTVVMVGTGIIKAMPDTALISGGVVSRARRAGDALRANNDAMAKVVAALKATSLNDAQITTSSFSFEPQYETDSKGNIDPDRRIVGYSVTNRITVTLKENVERAGEVLEALIQNGANDSADVSFEIRDMAALEMQAREAAAKDALARAQACARALGVELGAVRSVREGSQAQLADSITAEDIGRFPDNSIRASLQRIPAINLAARVQAGEQTITKVVTVEWALK